MILNHSLGKDSCYSAAIGVIKGDAVGQVDLSTYLYNNGQTIFVHEKRRGTDYGALQSQSQILQTALDPTDFFLHPAGVDIIIADDVWQRAPKHERCQFNIKEAKFVLGARFFDGIRPNPIPGFGLKQPQTQTSNQVKFYLGNRMLPIATFQQLENGKYAARLSSKDEQIVNEKELIKRLGDIVLRNENIQTEILEGRLRLVENYFQK